MNSSQAALPACLLYGNLSQLMYKQYVQFICGGLGVIAAAFALAILLLNKELRSNYRMFFNVALGHFLNALAWFLSAVQRQAQIANGTYTSCVRTIDCMATSYFGLFSIGTQLPTLANLCMAIERLAAIAFPIFYKVNWSRDVSNRFASGVLLFSVISCLAEYPVVYLTQPWQMIQAICLPVSFMGQYYGSYNYIFGCICCIISFVLSIFTVVLMRWRLKKARQQEAARHQHRYGRSRRYVELGSQQYKTISLVILSSVSFVFTLGTMSTFLGGVSGWFSIPQPLQLTQFEVGLYCLDAFVAVGGYMIANSEFRRGFVQLMRLACPKKKINNAAAVIWVQSMPIPIPSAREHGGTGQNTSHL